MPVSKKSDKIYYSSLGGTGFTFKPICETQSGAGIAQQNLSMSAFVHFHSLKTSLFPLMLYNLSSPPKSVSTLLWWWGLCDSVIQRAMQAGVV
jgi:hypothetical protein